MIEGGTAEDEWITHQLAGHVHDEEILVWDEALGNSWPAELRCTKCEAIRYLSRNEAVSKIAARNTNTTTFTHAGKVTQTWR